MFYFYDIFINIIKLLPLISITYIGVGMTKDYLEVSYLESEKNKKEN